MLLTSIKFKAFQGYLVKFKDFKALNLVQSNSRLFKDFKAPYEPCIGDCVSRLQPRVPVCQVDVLATTLSHILSGNCLLQF